VDQDHTCLPEAEAGALQAAALLQLAMNCSNPGTAEAAAQCIPDQIEVAAARKLLLTAAARQHTEATDAWLRGD
jgi:hypothetical protein